MSDNSKVNLNISGALQIVGVIIIINTNQLLCK